MFHRFDIKLVGKDLEGDKIHPHKIVCSYLWESLKQWKNIWIEFVDDFIKAFEISAYLQYEFPIPFDLQIPLFIQGEGLQDIKPVFSI